MKPVCLVIGAGAGIGGNVARKFAQEGYHSVLCRRSDEDGLNNMVAEIQSEGGSASGFLLNAIDDNSIEDRVAAVESDIGPIDTVIFNLGAQIGDRPLAATTYKAFEMGWRLATFGLFRAAHAPAHGGARQRKHHRDICHGSGSWQRRSTQSRRSHGRTPHVVPNPERAVFRQWHPCRTRHR